MSQWEAAVGAMQKRDEAIQHAREEFLNAKHQLKEKQEVSQGNPTKAWGGGWTGRGWVGDLVCSCANALLAGGGVGDGGVGGLLSHADGR